jgi:DNA modification methylase
MAKNIGEWLEEKDLPGTPETESLDTSIFDPVLTEICYKWFTPKGGKIIDPFAGGSVRGIIAAYLKYEYHGIDLRKEQIEANRKQAREILKNKQHPFWYVGDSVNIDSILKKQKYDFIFSCPPYFDLEIYSDMKEDLSNQKWEDFCKSYETIIRKSVSLLDENRFACFVVTQIRDKEGFYRKLVELTREYFEKAGMKFYNDIILVNVCGSLPLRVNRQFGDYRKVGRMHQNVLVFYKGDPKKIKEIFGKIEAG